jgi:integrase
VLSESQLKAILGAFEKKKPIELRRYAAVMCLAHLGLRACEVSALTLDDIDWRNETIRIPSTKTRRADFMPLPIPVARAVLDYLRRGRPQTDARQIFVCHVPPGVPAKPTIIRNAVRIAVERAGLDPHIGPHAFRHTIATRMLESGATIKQVADILRHRTIDTAAIYAKVNLSALREAAAPWPGSPA